MKKKFDFRILIIIILLIILIIMVRSYLNMGNSNISMNNRMMANGEQTQTIEQQIQENSKISQSAEVSSALTEQIELHATYYFSEIYVEANQKIAKGENILKYTNGTYLTAPYDCVIEEISIPEAEEQCTNKHYITVSAINNLQISIRISEEKIDSIELGQEADIEISAVEKNYKGTVVNISSTASNGYFTIKIEFENDGNVKLGMTANVEIAIK